MKCCNENLIKEAAYYIWEKEGKPCGKEQCHWSQAEKQVSKLLNSNCSSKKSPAKKATAKASTAKTATKKAPAKKAAAKKTKKK